MIWIFVRRDYGALERAKVAGRSVLLKVYTTTDVRHPHKHCRWQEKAEVLAQPLA
jgi:hypothetical protein